MRIRYLKPGGKEVDLPEGAARRLIASGQAEAVIGEEQPIQGTDGTRDDPTAAGAAAETKDA